MEKIVHSPNHKSTEGGQKQIKPSVDAFIQEKNKYDYMRPSKSTEELKDFIIEQNKLQRGKK